MSKYPGGPPPPYYGPPRHNRPRCRKPHHHGPPHSTSFTFVPTPVVMPVYTPPPPETQPTYVTNYHIYQPPETPAVVTRPPAPVPKVIKVVKEKIDWVQTTAASAANLSHRAFVGGKEGWDGSPLWIIRSHLSGELVPGKLAVKHRAAYVPHGGKEIPVHNFEVLCAPANVLRWVPSSNGKIPVGGLPAGNTHKAEPLYIGRVNHRGSITPGKVHPSHGCCYISFEGVEVPIKTYDVLCKFVG